MIKEWLENYNAKSEEEIIASLREIMQEVTLAALSRTNFFEKAAFYGGTALRIFHGLDRFSEDLDFSLLSKNENFSLEPYFDKITTEFDALGIKVSIKEKIKRKKSAIDSAFLKTDTIWQEIVLQDIVKQTGITSNKNIKIKIEVDTNPPLGFSTEEKLLVRPFSFYVKCFVLPSLFAGKLHALLFRKWKNRVKGRDWFDLEWYIKKGVPLDINHFLSRAIDSGDWENPNITQQQILEQLHHKIESTSIKRVKEDVIRFIKHNQALNIWSTDYFHDLIEKIKFEE